jgi:hypothetical protein
MTRIIDVSGIYRSGRPLPWEQLSDDDLAALSDEALVNLAERVRFRIQSLAQSEEGDRLQTQDPDMFGEPDPPVVLRQNARELANARRTLARVQEMIAERGRTTP